MNMAWTQRQQIIDDYQLLVLATGPGFHPDTPYDGYEPPIDFITEGEFEAVVDHAFGLDNYDVYEAGMAFLKQRDADLT